MTKAKSADARIVAELTEAEHRCSTAERELEKAKAEAKAAKDYYEQSVLHLRSLIRQYEEDADRPLLQEQEE